MSFVGVIAMDIANVRAHYSLNPATSSQNEEGGQHTIERNQSFYDSSMTVLFDLPNVVTISVRTLIIVNLSRPPVSSPPSLSPRPPHIHCNNTILHSTKTYVLLTLVWAECSLLSRFHTESSVQWRKRWLVWYMIFNSALYATQVILYILIFAGGRSKGVIVVRTIVNVAMAGINLCAVFLVFLLYLYLSVAFSGFPYRSQSSKEGLRKITNVLALWSVTRIIWGVSTLTIYIHDIDLLRSSSGRSAIILFFLLCCCEIAPIIVLMDYSFLTIFEFAESATRELSSLASGQHILTSERVVADEEDRQGSVQAGKSAEAALVGGSGSFNETTEPLLGRPVK